MVRKTVCAGALLLLLAMVAPAIASADSMSVSVSNASPAIGAPIAVMITTNASPIDQSGDGPYLFAVAQPSTAGGCQSTYGDDMQVVGSQATELKNYATQVNTGQTVTTYNFTAYAAGRYIICSWLEDTDEDGAGSSQVTPADVLATGSGTITTVNVDTLTASFAAAPAAGRPVGVVFRGNAAAIDQSGDGPYLYAVAQPASSGACQSTFGNDESVVGSQATVLVSGTQVDTGAYSEEANFTPSSGSYVVCAWLETDSNDASGSNDTVSVVNATAAPVSFAVGATAATGHGSTTGGSKDRAGRGHRRHLRRHLHRRHHRHRRR